MVDIVGLEALGPITDFLHGKEGRSMMGCLPAQVEEMISLANHKFPGKGVCVVRHWIFAELQVGESDKAALASAGIQPFMIWGGEVLQDQRRPFAVGGWMRSTPMVSFTEPCLFESRNSIYLLQGPGLAKSVAPDVILSFHG